MFTIWSVYMFALGQLLIAMCGAEVYRHIHYKDVETVVEDALLRELGSQLRRVVQRGRAAAAKAFGEGVFELAAPRSLATA